MSATTTETPLRRARHSALPWAARFQLGASLLWMLAGLALGLGMAATGDFALRSVHAHVQLLGWVTLCLTGLIYAVLPRAAEGALALWHVALHNLGLPVMVAALAAYHSGVPAAEPLIALGSVTAFAGLVAFALAVRRAL
jgi:hypothetical protein